MPIARSVSLGKWLRAPGSAGGLVRGITMATRPAAAPLLGVGDPGTGALGCAHEVLPPVCGYGVARGDDGVVALELALAVARDLTKEAEVQVGHGRARSEWEMGIDTAIASGSGWGASSSPISLNPTVSLRLDARSGLPHSRQAPI